MITHWMAATSLPNADVMAGTRCLPRYRGGPAEIPRATTRSVSRGRGGGRAGRPGRAGWAGRVSRTFCTPFLPGSSSGAPAGRRAGRVLPLPLAFSSSPGGRAARGPSRRSGPRRRSVPPAAPTVGEAARTLYSFPPVSPIFGPRSIAMTRVSRAMTATPTPGPTPRSAPGSATESAPGAASGAAPAPAPLRSELLRTLVTRGYVHQCTDLGALDTAAASGRITGYIGFDATADSLHVGSLVQIMLLRHMQRAGHRPIVLMGGGTTKVGDPSGRDKGRQLLSQQRIESNIAGIRRVFERFLDFEGSGAAPHGRQLGLARRPALHPVPARVRAAFFGQPDARLRVREAPPRPRAAALVPRVQLHGPPGLRLPGARAPLRLPPADGRLRPVGQHRVRGGARAPRHRGSICTG